MSGEGTAGMGLVTLVGDRDEVVWGTWAGPDDLTFAVPANWDDYPEGTIGQGGKSVRPAAGGEPLRQRHTSGALG